HGTGSALRCLGPSSALRLPGPPERSREGGAYAVLDVGPALDGVRGYLAFAGGLEPEPVLGSRSADLLSGLGPAPLSDGDTLPLGEPADGPPQGPTPWPGAPAELVLPLHLGPRHAWFTAAALRTLTTAAYRVSPHSNRIGLRTEGPALERARDGELPSEGMVLGAVQVPPDGRPVVFLNDHPTTGGYPVVGVVPETALAGAAQAVPGTRVRFSVRA
ncbi:biotin-dependent carboxyltransferase family protein, partial [Streptomyces cyaneofuscatus]|uniref:5-oxoprolinase subunit C family protein n=1 Tax=Streptomyces cyaneofuscatus TaxID=66883 RepID=UPI0033F203D2